MRHHPRDDKRHVGDVTDTEQEITCERYIKRFYRPRTFPGPARRLVDSSRSPNAQYAEHRRDTAHREPRSAPRAVACCREQPRYAGARQQDACSSSSEINRNGRGREIGPIGIEVAGKNAAADEDHGATDACDCAQAQLRDEIAGNA